MAKQADVVLISAVAANRTIGRGNDLPWHIPEDLKFFKDTTRGSTLVMGRRTFDSLGGRPLPGRLHIVITRNPDWLAPEGVWVASSLEEAVARAPEDKKTFLCGGASIYEEGIRWVSQILLTEIDAEIDGDTFFPVFDKQQFQRTVLQNFVSEGAGNLPVTICRYDRIATV